MPLVFAIFREFSTNDVFCTDFLTNIPLCTASKTAMND